MTTRYLRIDYSLGSLAADGPGTGLVYNDLTTAGAGPLSDRVGLGRVLTLPYILETPIQLRVQRLEDLAGRPRQLVAQFLESSGSTLVVAGANAPPGPLDSSTGQNLTDATRFLTDIAMGRFLAPTRIHPPRDLSAAGALAADLRQNRLDLRAIARRLTELGYLTRSGSGAWQPGTVQKKEGDTLLTLMFEMYVCRGCGTEIAYPQRFRKCPVCGIELGCGPIPRGPPKFAAERRRPNSSPCCWRHGQGGHLLRPKPGSGGGWTATTPATLHRAHQGPKRANAALCSPPAFVNCTKSVISPVEGRRPWTR